MLQRLTVPYGLVWTRELDLQAACRTTLLSQPRPFQCMAVWGNMGRMASDAFDDIPLEPAEQLDSDEVRNDDGDEVVDPPDEWIDAKDNETLDQRLAEETPDNTGDDEDEDPPRDAHDSDAGGGLTLVTNYDIDRIDTERHGREYGQIDGTPEDGESFYDVID